MGELGFLLEEVCSPDDRFQNGEEVGFSTNRFRKVRPTNIEIFRQIAANPRTEIKETDRESVYVV